MASQSSHPSSKQIPTFVVKSTSYAGITQKDTVPKRDQGIILDGVEGLSLTEYTSTIGDIVQPTNIIGASRISRNRICIYLSSKEIVKEFTDKYSYITIGEQKVTLRPLVSNQKRIIFSNVPLHLPNEILENVLNDLNVHRSSPITVLKASINKDGYKHVASFRRQVYAKQEDLVKIPEMFKIIYEERTYFIYSSTDVIKCFICNLDGHLAKNCTNIPVSTTQNVNTETSNNNNTDTLTQFCTNPVIAKHNSGEQRTAEITIDDITAIDNKRTHSQISSTESQADANSINNETLSKSKKQISKRSKKITDDIKINSITDSNKIHSSTNHSVDITEEIDNLEELDETDKKLVSIKSYLDQANTLLNYIQFKSLLENIKGCKNPDQIILQYTDNLDEFVKFIEVDIYPNVRDAGIKSKCTKLLNKIRNKYSQESPTHTPVSSDIENESHPFINL